MTQIFVDWPEHAAQSFGRRPLKLRHSLAAHRLFSNDALIRLIEATPRRNYHVNTMPRGESDPRRWREGDMSGLSGVEVLEAVAKGELWVHLQRVQELDFGYGELLDAAFDELAQRVPGFETFRRSMSVLISSPCMSVAYHADVPGQSLWQARGRKRVWIYPARAPFLPQRAIENIVLKRSLDTDLDYCEAFDAEAESFVLEPGDMASWPRNCPHRVENEDCLNVSFTTEHWTRELSAAYAVDYANGLLRPWLQDRDLARATSGPAFYGKLALAGAHKLLRRLHDKPLPLSVDFRVAPGAARGFQSVAPQPLAK